MSLRTFVLAPVCLAVLFVAAVCRGEDNDQYMHSDPYQPDLMQPFIAPDTFDLDYQFFAPADFDTYGGDVPLRTGWYITYDRMNLAVSRPSQTVSAPYRLDKTWGNRFDLGYMTEENHGWQITVMNLDGPNEPDNHAGFNSVEVIKTFRIDPFHNGSVLEPFIGARYVLFEDFLFREEVDVDPITGLTTIDELFDQGKNNILGGEIGARWYKKKGRWTLSIEGRAFAAINWQQADGGNHIYVFDDLEEPPIAFLDISFFGVSSDAFVPMGELRVEASYDVTRDIALRAGLEAMYFGRGIFRVTESFDADQQLTLVGATFGIVYNR